MDKRGIITLAKVESPSVPEFMPAEIDPPFKEEKILEGGISEDGNEHDIPTGQFKTHKLELSVPETEDTALVKRLREYQKNGTCEDWTYTEYSRATGKVKRTVVLKECTLTEMKPDKKGTKSPTQAFVKFQLMPADTEDIE